ncbi:uncharacterized protein LOC123500387 [Portunus trituberculatus]|uniref:uncharacterized protein LOC123500387 n=1 Tax=Portunus trituberculatus TaxID=210409 RepID=UPI001E1D01CA|nr:uncharacterized protein LOC123500387 [Portunus trituberculatus]
MVRVEYTVNRTCARVTRVSLVCVEAISVYGMNGTVNSCRISWSLRRLYVLYDPVSIIMKARQLTSHCGDHFDAKWLGIKGRLPSNAVPNPTDGCEDDASHIEYDGFGATINAPEMRKTSLISNVLPLNQIYDSNFGCLSEDSFNQVPLLVEEVYWW